MHIHMLVTDTPRTLRQRTRIIIPAPTILQAVAVVHSRTPQRSYHF